MKRVMLTICLMLVLLGGCAGPFVYDNPGQRTRLESERASIQAQRQTLDNTMTKVQRQQDLEKSLENGQVYAGMPVTDFLNLWGTPSQTQDLGQGTVILSYAYEDRIGVHRFRFPTNSFYFTNGLLSRWSKE